MTEMPKEVSDAIDNFNAKKITVEELQKIGMAHGVRIAGYDITKERDQRYPIGNNDSREGFTWNISHKNSIIFQKVVKPAIIKGIDKVHAWVLKSWDRDGFKYDDPRLQYLDQNLHGFVSEYFDHDGRKLNFMHQAVDIGMFLLKEDLFYRGRVFQMINMMPRFKLTPLEEENIARHTAAAITERREESA